MPRLGCGDKGCVFCESDCESLNHIFLFCPFVRSIAFSSQWRIRLDDFPYVDMHSLLKDVHAST